MVKQVEESCDSARTNHRDDCVELECGVHCLPAERVADVIEHDCASGQTTFNLPETEESN